MVFRLIYYMFCLLCLSCSVSYDIQEKKDLKINQKQNIQFEYTYFILDDDSLLYDIFYKIPYNDLIFEKEEKNFISRIIVDITVSNDRKIIFSDSFEKNIEAVYFENTNLSDNNFFYYQLSLPKGINKITLTINDYKNHKFWNYSSQLNSDDYDLLSKISFYNKIDGKYIYINDDFSVNASDTLWMKYQIIDNQLDDINCELFEFGKLLQTINIQKEQLNNKIIDYFPLDIKQFNRRLEVYVNYKDVSREKTINIYGSNNEKFNFVDLIGPIEYLFNRKEYIQYSGIDSLEKIDYIKEYWDKKFNENLLYEFYGRVKYVNSQYSQMKTKGWMSDRGRIHILHGQPLRISHDFSDEGEFEIWSYSSKKIIFINKHGIFECYICN